MAGSTTFYRMAYFDFGDKLDTAINAHKEIRRFTFLDSQLFGMFNVFGNGVVDGWELYDDGYSDATGISLGITSGRGIISYLACETNSPAFIRPVPSNQTLYIYAVSTSESTEGRQAVFSYSSIELTSNRALLIGQIVTSDNGITTINNDVRTYVGFAQYVLDAVNDHKHRGSPTKIDLVSETKNELPGASIDGFDVSKLVSGKIDIGRIPVIQHSSLAGKGILTHAALDTFAQGLTGSSNLELLGEVASVNLLRTLISLKPIYTTIDKYLVNEITYVPQITTSIPDHDASTAYIDDVDGYVVGLPIGDDRISYFYTDNFYLPGNTRKIILTSNNSIPEGGDIQFAVNTTNSTIWSNYQLITENRVSSVTSRDTNLRIGIKFISPGPGPEPYATLFEDFIDFVFANESSSAYFNFRIRFYEDADYSNLYATRYSGDSQEGWIINDSESMPCNGYYIETGDSATVSYYPDTADFIVNKTYYLIIDAYNGSSFVSEMSGYTFVYYGGTSACPYDAYPFIRNMAFMFELANGKLVKLNI